VSRQSGFTAILLQFSFANWIINYPIVSPFAANWHIGELGGGGSGGSKGGGRGGGRIGLDNRFRSNACGALAGTELAVAARFVSYH